MKNKNVVFAVEIKNNEIQIEEFGKSITYLYKKLLQDEKISEESYVLFIDNGSKDNSWYEISKQKARYVNIFKGVRLKQSVKNEQIISFINNEIKDDKNCLVIFLDLQYSKDDIMSAIVECEVDDKIFCNIRGENKQTFGQIIKNIFSQNVKTKIIERI